MGLGPGLNSVGKKAMPVTHLLYLHGFCSSPQSAKARQTSAWVQAHAPGVQWWCPQLPPSPREAMAMVFAGMAHWPRANMAVIGSSLGGFYATVVAEQTGCPAVVLNPAVHPARDLAAYIGETKAYHSDETFFFRPEFVAELQALSPAGITRPERYLAVIAKGDEVLDWREMTARYSACPTRLLEGGDHALSNYAEQLPHVMQFLGLDEFIRQTPERP
jgi:predicted esterase YcpF (UPF0227 family)